MNNLCARNNYLPAFLLQSVTIVGFNQLWKEEDMAGNYVTLFGSTRSRLVVVSQVKYTGFL